MFYRKSVLVLAIAALSLGFTQEGVAGFGGSGIFGNNNSHHFVKLAASWTTANGLWNTDPAARTVSLTVNTATCDLEDLDFSPHDGTEDTTSTSVTGVSCSLTFTYTLPTNRVSTCTGGVRTYQAFCEEAQFNLSTTAGMTGHLTINIPASPSMTLQTILTHLGCSTPSGGTCTFQLGSLPSRTQGGGLVLDTRNQGCQEAFPAATVELPGTTGPVTLSTNQLLQYKETCGTSTIIPIEQGARICSGEADAPMVTDCQQVGSGSNLIYHVAFQQNIEYLFTITRTAVAETGLNLDHCPGNNGQSWFTLFGQAGLDVNDINVGSVTAGVIGTAPYQATPNTVSIGFFDGDGFEDIMFQFTTCDLVDTAISAGTTVQVEVIGTATSGGETLPWHAVIDSFAK